MPQKSISGRSLNNAITSEDILGKEAIDIEGKVVGVVERVLIDPQKLNLIGITIDRGLVYKSISIGKNYVKSITKRAVFLKIRIPYEIRGAKVFDINGKLIGNVSNVELRGNQNVIKNIVVSRGILRKKVVIPGEFIRVAGESVILNKTKESLDRL